jgi:hypothetical protein
MRQVKLIALVSVLALFIGGCPIGDESEQAVQTTPVAKIPATPRTKPSPSATPFANPLTPKQPRNSTTVAGLIQVPPPEAEAKRINKGRNDPFAAIEDVRPEVTVSPNPGSGETARPVPVVPPLPLTPRRRIATPRTNGGTDGGTDGGTNGGTDGGTNGGRTGGRTGGTTGGTTRTQAQAPRPRNVLPRPPQQRPRPQSPVAVRPTPNTPNLPPPGTTPLPLPPPPPNFTPELPKLPEPTQAKGIEVTGVVEVGGVPTAIVNVPNEPSRYVREGQRLSNGQVLVKRIEMNRGPEPVVILEQYGIEVARRVGERPAGSPEEPEVPTASLPALMLENTNSPA